MDGYDAEDYGEDEEDDYGAVADKVFWWGVGFFKFFKF